MVLARCAASEGGPPPDQGAYEPLFANASSIMTNYRSLLNARRTIPAELVKVAVEAKPAGKTTGKTGAASSKPPRQQSVKK